MVYIDGFLTDLDQRDLAEESAAYLACCLASDKNQEAADWLKRAEEQSKRAKEHIAAAKEKKCSWESFQAEAYTHFAKEYYANAKRAEALAQEYYVKALELELAAKETE